MKFHQTDKVPKFIDVETISFLSGGVISPEIFMYTKIIKINQNTLNLEESCQTNM